jgi:hypothetical protein
MRTEPDLMKLGLLRARVGLAVAAVFLLALYLVGSDTCLDSGGRVERLLYCSFGSGQRVSFPSLVRFETLLILIVGPVLLGGIAGTWVWFKYIKLARH